MFFSRWPALRGFARTLLNRTSRKAAATKRRAARLMTVERLEDRTLLSASIWTDHLDYPPGATAVINGSGFQAGETVDLQVVNVTNGHTYTPWTVTDGGANDLDGKLDGYVQTTWVVPGDAANCTLQLTATGETSGLTAQETFTDASSISSVSLGAQAGSVTYGTSGSVTYSGQLASTDNGNGTANITITGLPTGVTFTPTSVSFNGNTSPANFTLTLTTTGTPGSTPAGSFSFTLTATNQNNSSNKSSVSGTLTVNKATVTGSITASNKVYDGTTAAAIATRSLSGVIGSDNVSLTGGTATFADKNVGNNKPVTATGLSLTGTAASNYTLSNPTETTSANITQAPLTVTATGGNKVYDGTTSDTVTLSDNRVSGDVLTDSDTSAAFANKNVGTNKTVTVSGISISGADAGNYALQNTTASTTANIAARALTVTAAGVNKTYDGTASDTVTLTDNRVSGDVFTDGYTSAAFANKNVGTNKTVTVSGISISGTDAANYTLTSTTAGTTANITARSLTVSATGVNKVYDGTTAATVNLSDNRVSGDVLTDGYTSSTFSDKNVANGKAVSVSGISISGTDAGNYSLQNTTATTTANITARALTITAATNTKTYDATASAAATPTVAGLQGTDTVTGLAEAYTDANAGTGKTLTVTTYTVNDGNSGNNYMVSLVNNTTGVINQVATSTAVSAPAVTYNANGSITVTVSSSVGTPTGNVSLSVDGGAATTMALTNGSAVFVTSSPNSGDHSLSANYAAQGNYAASSTTGTLHVNQAATTTSISAPTVTYNANGTVTVSVSSSAGTPTGNVTLSVDGGSPTTQALSGGSAVFTLTSPSAGSHSLSASYPAQGNFAASSATGNLSVNAAATSVSISAPAITYNSNGTVTVSVSAPAGVPTPTGNVTLSVDGGAAVAQALVNGSATFTVSSPSAGDHSLSAGFTAQGNYAASSASGSLHVNQAPTSVSLSAPDVTYNSNGTVTVTVGAAAGVPTPTGNVTLSVDGGAAVSQALVNGSVTFTITSPSAGSHSLSASYAAQGNYAASSTTGSLTVHAAATSVSLSAPQVTYNTNGSVTVTVGAANGVPTPTGNVTLTVDGDSAHAQTLTLDGSGQASFTLTSPAAGDHGLSASYTPTTNYQASSATGSLHVNAAPTTTAVNASTITYNETGTVTVTVSAAAGVPTPTGNVTLTLDSGTPQTAALDANSQATFSIVGPSAGNHTLTADFAAQGNYAASSSTIVLYSNQSATSVAVSAPAVTYNANGTVTVTVTSPDGTPSGDVALTVDNTTTYTAALSGGQAVFTLTSPPAGNHSLSASFAAQGNFAASSAIATLHVDQAATGITVGAPTVTYNANGTVTVTVSSASGTPAGNVSLSVDGGAMTMALDANGQAVFTLTSPAAGNHSLHAVYSAQGNFAGSTADATLHVNQAATSVSINAPTVTYNADGTVTVTVTPQQAGVPTPAGNVSLSVDGGAAMTMALDANGQAVFTVTSPAAGSHSLSATYAAQGNFAASSASGSLAVNQAPTMVSIAAPDVTYDHDGVVTVTVSPQQSGVPTVTGDVTLTVDGGTTYTATLSGGQAVFTLTSPTAADHPLVAGYAAQGNYGASSASGNLHVNQAATATAISAPDITYNAEGVVTVTVSPVEAGVPTPTGHVSLSINGGAAMTATLVNGQANFTIAQPDAGDYTLDATYAAQGNYAGSSASSMLHVNKADATITINPYSGTYDGLAHGLTGTATGIQDEDLSSLLNLGASEIDAGHYTINWSFAGNTNSNSASGSSTIDIAQAALTVTVDADPATAAQNAFARVYGDADPAFSVRYAGFVHGETAAALGGSLSYGTDETPASGVGGYTVSAGGLTSNNYAITYVSDTLNVTPRPVAVAADARSKVYGGADPALTYAITSGSLVNGDAFTGGLSRGAGEHVGGYAIRQGSLALSGNYALAFTGSTLTITPATLSVSADAQTKVYGSADPVLTYHVSGFQFSDTEASVLSGALSRAAGEHVGSYAIGQGGLVANADYTISFTGSSLTITPATLLVSADVRTKVYGSADPALTYQVSGFQFSDTEVSVLSGALSRAAGEHVGSYAINQGTLTADSDYTISFTGNSLTITPATLTVSADAQTKVYGQADPSLTYQVSGFQFTDTEASILSGALSRAAGEHVGSYAIGQGGLVANSDYTISFTGSSLTITPATLSVQADAQTKVYGDPDPALTYQLSGFRFNDTEATVLSGALSRAAGEHVGSYAIGQGSLVANADYTISFTGSSLTITPATLTVSADAQAKVYGAADPALTYHVSGFQFSDTEATVLSGALARAAGEHVGSYAIVQGSLVADADYTISFTGNSLTITPATLTVQADAQTKVYGDADPALTYQVSGFRFSDTEAAVLSGALSRAAGEHVGSYAIGQGSLVANSDYTIAFTGNSLTITPAMLTVTADAQTKVYGQADPALSYHVSGFQFSDTEASVLSGALARAVGEHVGGYAIGQGTLTANSDYTISFTGSSLTITPATLVVSADVQTKVYGHTDPALTFVATGFQFSDTEASVLSGALSRAAGEHVGGYAVGQGTLTADADYTISFTGNSLTITPATLSVSADPQTKVYGAADPALTYHVSGFQFSDTEATVLSGALARAAGEHVGSYAIVQGSLVADADYTISFTGNSLAITPATLTVSADAQTKIYGQADPTLTYQVSGFQFSDTEASVLSGALSRAAGEHVSGYAIGQGTLTADADYTISFTGNSLTITPATLTVSADAQTKVYGGADPALTYQVSGFQFTDNEATVLSGALARAAGEHVSGYAIGQGTLAADSDYTISFTGSSLTITPATLFVSADPQTKVYGQADPTLTYQVSGFQFSDTEASVLSGALARAAGEHVGSYAITQGTLVANTDYTISYTGNSLAITPAHLTVTADANSKTYGQTATESGGISGIQYGDAISATFASDGDVATADAGSYAITGVVSGSNLATDYVIDSDLSDVGTLTVNPAHLTVTVDAASKTYGQTFDDANYVGHITGIQNGDAISGTFSSGGDPATADAGSYAVSAVLSGGKLAQDYVVDSDLSDVGTLTVNRASATINITPYSGTYDGLAHGLTGSAIGALGEDLGSLLHLGTTYVDAGSYTVAWSFDGNNDYVPAGGTSTIDISQAPLTVAVDADPATAAQDAFARVYGDADPAFAVRYAGFVHGETAAALGGALRYGTDETQASGVGAYAVSAGGLTSNNYAITYVSDTLNVTPRPVAVAADARSKVYGGADPALTYAITSGSLVNGDAFTGGLSRGAGEHVGGYAIRQGSLALSGNYALAFTGSTLTITPATLSVAADNQEITYGQALPTFTATAVGLENGDTLAGLGLTFTGNSQTAVHAGTYTITPVLSSNDYTITLNNGTLTIDKAAALTVTADDQSKVYGDADPTLTYTVTGTTYYGDVAQSVVSGVSLSTDTGAAAAAGTHTILASGGVAADYNVVDVNGTLSVSKATLTVTTNDKSKVYGGADPALDYSVSGLKYSDTAAVVSGVSLSTATGAAATAGTHAITAAGGSADNYNVVDVNGALTVAKAAALTVTADDQSKVYGDADPALTYTVSGTTYYGDVAQAAVSGVTLSTATGAAATAGTHTITASGGSAANYEVVDANGTLTVSKAAALTVTADDKQKVYGAADPALTYTVTGTTYYGDVAQSVVSGVSLSTSTGAAAAAGTHTITATGGIADNYEVVDADGTLTVSKAAALTVTADNQSKVYGAADPALTYTVTGTTYYGDVAQAVVSGVSLATATGAAATAGTHAITATGGTADNYEVVDADGTLTVSKAAALTVTADDKAKVYGDSDPALTYTVSGTTYYGDVAQAAVSGVTLSTAMGAAATAGTHAITASGGVAANYEVVDANGTLTVAKAAALTVTADDKQKVYGAGDPALTYTVTGVTYYGDNAQSVVSGVSLSTTTGAAATAGTHAITASGGAADNYEVVGVNGTLTVSKAAALIVTADGKQKVYGAADPALTYTVTGVTYYGDVAQSVVSGVSLSTATGAAATAGTHAITASGGAADNYEVVDASGTLTVSKAAALTVTADDKAKVYGDSDPTLTYTVTGATYYGDVAQAVVSGVSLSTVAGAAATAGPHTITATGGSAANYNVVDAGGTLTVAKAAALTVTADDRSKVYGAADPALTYTVSGTTFYGDVAQSVVSGVSLATATGAAATAGTHTIAATGGVAANYNVVDADGTLTVSKAAALTVTADNQSKVYGAADPALTYTVSGTTYYGDVAQAVVSGVSLSTATGAAATAGTHQITATGGTAANYDVVDVNGTLSVSKAAALTVTADDKQKVYGDSDPALTYTVTGATYYGDVAQAVVSGVSLSTATGAAATAGTHAITATGGVAANYNIVDANGTLTVSRRSVTVTADAKSKTYGDADPALTYQVTHGNTVYGDTFTGGLTRAPGENVGAYAINQGTLALSGNYILAYVGANLTINPRAITVTADAKSKVYGDADPALTYHLSGGNLVGSDGFSGALTRVPGETVSGSPYAILQGSLTAGGNYSLAFVGANLTITKATLTVNADNKVRPYGIANPSLTGTLNGIKNGDVITAAFATTATPSSAVGNYPITLGSLGDPSGKLSNYTVVVNNGTLTVTVGGSIYVLNPTASGALTLSGNASITVPGNVVVDSTSSSAVTASGNAFIQSAGLEVAGGVKTSGSPAVTKNGAPLATNDPLGLAAIPTTGLMSYGAVNLSGNATQTLCPGVYSSISASGNATLILNPGVYYIQGGGLVVSGNASIKGAGVLIYNTVNGSGSMGGITLSGNGTFSLSPYYTSGPYAGVLIFQSAANTRALALSGNAMLGVSGTVYAPTALLTLSGNAQLGSLTNPISAVVNTLNLSGNVSLAETAAGSDGAGDLAGIADTLLAGNLSVYVDNSAGYFTADELARIRDAVTSLDALLAPYNVSITLVGDPAAANLVFDAGLTSACGDMGDGVLGCYNPGAKEITLIEGWNWYAGADPAQISADQYDFETTVLHEFGHALGLGHGSDPNSPMFETLPTGTAHRAMTAQDLNIPDPPEGADPLTAAGFTPKDGDGRPSAGPTVEGRQTGDGHTFTFAGDARSLVVSAGSLDARPVSVAAPGFTPMGTPAADRTGAGGYAARPLTVGLAGSRNSLMPDTLGMSRRDDALDEIFVEMGQQAAADSGAAPRVPPVVLPPTEPHPQEATPSPAAPEGGREGGLAEPPADRKGGEAGVALGSPACDLCFADEVWSPSSEGLAAGAAFAVALAANPALLGDLVNGRATRDRRAAPIPALPSRGVSPSN